MIRPIHIQHPRRKAKRPNRAPSRGSDQLQEKSMTTICQGRTNWRGRTIAATLLASAATVVGLFGAAAPANAADQYIALALGYVNENPPVTMAGGSAIAGSQDAAAQGALTNCVKHGGSQCGHVVIGTNECAAAASNNYGEEVGAKGSTVAAASSAAL